MEADTDLLNAARMLDEDALVKIFDLYSSPLYGYALRLWGDPVIADQVVGDVFTKLLDQFACGKGPSTNLRSYLYQTAYHQVIDEQRSSRRQAPLEAAEWPLQDGNVPYASLENQLLFQQVSQAIRKCLSEDQRHVVILRFLEGFSLRETALIIGKGVPNVRVIQNRAIAALRRILDIRAALPFSDI